MNKINIPMLNTIKGASSVKLTQLETEEVENCGSSAMFVQLSTGT